MRVIWLTLGWVCGIVLAANNPASSSALSLAWAGVSVLALLACALMPRRMRWPGLALLALTLGGLRMSLTPTGSELARFNDQGGATVEGVVSAAPESRDGGLRLRVMADALIRDGQRLPVAGELLALTTPGADFLPGDRVRATGLLQRPGEFGDYSWSDFLARRGIFSVMRDATVERLAERQGVSLQGALHDLRRRAGEHIERHLPAPQSALLQGILLGDESGLSPAMRQAFSVTGAAHVIAISGFNMIILSGAVMALVRRTRLSPLDAAAIGVATILLYTLFVGAGAAVLRATLVSSLLIIAGALRRRVYAPASLACATLLMSLENPTVLWDVGFQLSVFAALGVMLLVDPIGAGLRRLLSLALPRESTRRLADLLVEPLVVSLAAQIATLPLLLRYFGILSLISLPVNLLIVPVQAPLLILGLLATLTAFIAPLPAQLLYWLDLLPLTWTTAIVSRAAALPGAAGELQADPRLVAVIYMVFVMAAPVYALRHAIPPLLLRTLVRLAGGGATLLLAGGLAALLLATLVGRPDGMLHLWLLDVGHANAVLLQGPAGEQILIDGGRAPSRLHIALGERLPFHDRRLEVVALSAPEPETIDTLQSLLPRHEIGLLLHNGRRDLPPQLVDAAAKVLAPVAGTTLQFGSGLEIDVLHPQATPGANLRGMRSESLALRLRYGSISFLLPSGLDREGQRAMLAAGATPRATVLQLPLHGAMRSLDAGFLPASEAQLALVHADPDDARNWRGDPDADLLAMLNETPLLRSDVTGPLHLWSDGERLWRDFLPQERR